VKKLFLGIGLAITEAGEQFRVSENDGKRCLNIMR
jgi:hypothetical protein